MTSFSGSDARAERPAEGQPRAGHRLPRVARLADGREIRRVVRSGRRLVSGAVHVFVAAASSDRPRVAIVVPRFGHSAVQRNRLRRRLREIARTDWLPLAAERPLPLDVVLMARTAAYHASFDELRTSLQRTFESI